jgi:hypothetical protein
MIRCMAGGALRNAVAMRSAVKGGEPWPRIVGRGYVISAYINLPSISGRFRPKNYADYFSDDVHSAYAGNPHPALIEMPNGAAYCIVVRFVAL